MCQFFSNSFRHFLGNRVASFSPTVTPLMVLGEIMEFVVHALILPCILAIREGLTIM